MLLLFPSSTTTLPGPIPGEVTLTHADAVFNTSTVGAGGVALEQAEIRARVGPLVIGTVPSVTWAIHAAGWSWVAQITAGNRTTTNNGGGTMRLMVREHESVTFWARPTNDEGTVIYTADVETALVSVFDTSRANKSTSVFEEELVVGDVTYTALQLSKGWKPDALGYSVKYTLPAGILVEGGRKYRVELVLRTYNDGPRSVVWEVETSSLWTSRSHLGV